MDQAQLYPDPQWREMDDAERTRAYSPSSMLDGPIDPFIQAYVDQSAAAYEALSDVRTISYGPKPSNTFDLVVPPSEHPVALHVFIHGGYWQQLGKADSFFAAPDTLAHGMAYGALDYTLAPHASVGEIVDECCQALAHIHAQAKTLGIDPKRIIVSGSSAGAHLAAMCCLKMPVHCRPKGAVLVSGIFELEPLIGTYINEALSMDIAQAKANSPQLADLSDFVPSVIAWGAQDTDESKRQSSRFARQLIGANVPFQCIEMNNRNHFDIVMDLANDSALGAALRALAS